MSAPEPQDQQHHQQGEASQSKTPGAKQTPVQSATSAVPRRSSADNSRSQLSVIDLVNDTEEVISVPHGENPTDAMRRSSSGNNNVLLEKGMHRGAPLSVESGSSAPPVPSNNNSAFGAGGPRMSGVRVSAKKSPSVLDAKDNDPDAPSPKPSAGGRGSGMNQTHFDARGNLFNPTNKESSRPLALHLLPGEGEQDGATHSTADGHSPTSATYMGPPANTNNSGAGGSSSGGGKKLKQTTLNFGQPMNLQVNSQLQDEIDALKQQLLEKDLKILQSENLLNTAAQKTSELQAAFDSAQSNAMEATKRIARYQEVLGDVMQESAIAKRREARRDQHNKHFELGQAVTVHSATGGAREMWCEGSLPRDLRRKIEEVAQRQKFIDGQRNETMKKVRALTRQAKKQQQQQSTSSASNTVASPFGITPSAGGTPTGIVAPTIPNIVAASSASNVGGGGGGGGGSGPFASEDPSNDQSNGPQNLGAWFAGVQDVDLAILEAEEELQVFKQELTALEAESEALRTQYSQYEAQRTSFLKELSRIREEDSSQFATVKTIGQGRYVLINLLGKGGFSEVWKSFDLVEARVVACKVHRINKEWNRQTKDHYLKHASRELDIMRKLNHPRLTQLYDVFEHDDDTFVSVMEFSAGVDLDTHLKRNRSLREQDARIIMMQLIAALRHLAEQPTPIIHYDLKPANILFHSELESSLDIKITDFGLSKIITQNMGMSDDPSVELTSVGTGTFYYLPPECFNTSSVQLISSKVDIWAIGIIFYQMLYGKRPFAEGQSQKSIWSNNLIVNKAKEGIVFPDRPKVSDEAKEVIIKCLRYNSTDRPDVVQLSQDNYFRPLKKRNRSGQQLHNAAPSDNMPPPM